MSLSKTNIGNAYTLSSPIVEKKSDEIYLLEPIIDTTIMSKHITTLFRYIENISGNIYTNIPTNYDRQKFKILIDTEELTIIDNFNQYTTGI